MALKDPREVTVVLKADVAQRLREAYPGADPRDVVLRAVKKAIGEAELQRFAAAKQAEVQEEARRLNEELEQL